jgi:NADPH-dependent 2,4-dienoyl-CoA reductase/sulfur reductase-like enzyme
VAGIDISGGAARFPGVVGTAITKFFELEIARTGLSEGELQLLGIEHVAAAIDARTRAHYYPKHAPVKVKLLVAPGSGRLLGAQIVGGPGSGKRIDVAATALHAQLSVAQLVDLDLAYAPPFSPVWDPVQTAARVLLGKLGGE